VLRVSDLSILDLSSHLHSSCSFPAYKLLTRHATDTDTETKMAISDERDETRSQTQTADTVTQRCDDWR
jgi:hypothetical protein